jgi:hypothetical protein
MNPYYKPLPPEIKTATTAWPYMRRRWPWMFGDDAMGTKDARLPGAEVPTPVERDVIQVALCHCHDLKLADIAEALTGRREYGGAIYTRVKAVKKYLENTTTTDQGGPNDEFLPELAA